MPVRVAEAEPTEEFDTTVDATTVDTAATDTDAAGDPRTREWPQGPATRRVQCPQRVGIPHLSVRGGRFRVSREGVAAPTMTRFGALLQQRRQRCRTSNY